MHSKIFIPIILFMMLPILSLYASGDKIICPVCGAENPKGAKFCWKCGAPLKQVLQKKKPKKGYTKKIAPSDSLLQTLKEIKDLLKEIKEELRYSRAGIYSKPQMGDSLLRARIPKKPKEFSVIKEKKKENNSLAIGIGLTGCLIIYLLLLLPSH